MEYTKLNSVAIKGDRPFIKRYTFLADHFLSYDEKRVIEDMTEEEFLKLIEVNNWILPRNKSR